MTPAEPSDIIIDSGCAFVRIDAGVAHRLQLVDRASAGLMWHLEEMPKFLRQLPTHPDHEPPQASSDPLNIPGGGFGMLIFRFEATGPGEGFMTLRQRRPWEGAFEAEDEVSMRVFCAEPAALGVPISSRTYP